MRVVRRDPWGVTEVRDDPYRHVGDAEVFAPGEDVIVSLARWRREASALRRRPGRTGIRVPGEADPAEVAAALEGAALVAIEIPTFTDGRAYSTARLLRSRHGYAGELRAVGDVLRDQLLALWRCGFDAFELAGLLDEERAVEAFDDFSVRYQPDARGTPPIWRRRADAAER